MKIKNKKLLISISIILGIFILISIGWYARLDRFGLSKIDWVDCLQVDKEKYYSDFQREEISEDIIGDYVGKVRFTVSDNVGNSGYHFRNWDATYLAAGSEIYKVNGDNALAVRVDGKYYIYRLKNSF